MPRRVRIWPSRVKAPPEELKLLEKENTTPLFKKIKVGGGGRGRATAQ